jgi:PleD family two-component response regulator
MGQTLLRCVNKLRKLRNVGSQQTDMEDQEDLVGGGNTEQGAGDQSQGGSGKVLTSESQENDHQQGANQSDQDRAVGSMPSRPKDKDSRDKEKSDLRVLLVDDNALNLRLLNTFIKKAGYSSITKGENGQQAVEAVRNQSDSFHIVFMGRKLPGSLLCQSLR